MNCDAKLKAFTVHNPDLLATGCIWHRHLYVCPNP